MAYVLCVVVYCLVLNPFDRIKTHLSQNRTHTGFLQILTDSVCMQARVMLTTSGRLFLQIRASFL
jgi:hypothetical protein